MAEKSPQEVRQRANQFAREHVRELASEIIEWQDTALLRDGRLRELAEIWGEIDSPYALPLAERTAVRMALESASQSGGGEAVTEAMMIAGARSLIDGQENRPGSSWADEAKLCFEAMNRAAPSAGHDYPPGTLSTNLRQKGE